MKKAPGQFFGKHLRALREKGGLTLRGFCSKHGLDPSNYSKLERGLLPPPGPELLPRYAKALGIKPETQEWSLLQNAAVASGGAFAFKNLSGETLLKVAALVRALDDPGLALESIDTMLALV